MANQMEVSWREKSKTFKIRRSEQHEAFIIKDESYMLVSGTPYEVMRVIQKNPYKWIKT